MEIWRVLIRDNIVRTEERTELIKSFSLLKRNALAAPFEQAFAIQQRLEANPPAQDAVAVKQELMILDYR